MLHSIVDGLRLTNRYFQKVGVTLGTLTLGASPWKNKKREKDAHVENEKIPHAKKQEMENLSINSSSLSSYTLLMYRDNYHEFCNVKKFTWVSSNLYYKVLMLAVSHILYPYKYPQWHHVEPKIPTQLWYVPWPPTGIQYSCCTYLCYVVVNLRSCWFFMAVICVKEAWQLR